MAQGHQQNLPDPTGWGDYMQAKKAKLEAQFEADRPSGPQTQIFREITIFVNGWTVPSADELRSIMLENGGSYHMYKSRRVTHVVVTTLPTSKIERLKLGEKVVHPDWIMDSLKAGKLLPYLQYSHYHLKKFGVASMEQFLIGNEAKRSVLEKKSDPGPSEPGPNLNKGSPEKGVLKTTDPNFIKQFYARSRLHHISTAGQEMKTWVRKRKVEHDGRFPSLEKAMEKRVGQSQPISVGIKEKVIMHIDMDCFFVSVGLRNMPHLKGQPVAVTSAKYGQSEGHNSTKEGKDSWAEIASCSYEARAMGVKNGMLLGRAFEICPDIVTLPYDFQSYQNVSHTLYQTLADYTLQIDAVSCDELFVDFSSVCAQTGMTPLYFADLIRKEMRQKTGCPASVGIGPNKLIARLATKKAKPDGQYHVTGNEILDFMRDQPLSQLPNVGRMTTRKLEGLGVTKCGELERLPIATLTKHFGPKSGIQLLEAAKGRQNAEVGEEKLRKSVSCDINYGIRLHDKTELEIFVHNLSAELAQKLHESETRGRHIALKIMVRAAGAPVEPEKFGGHGRCDTLTRSKSLPFSTDQPEKLAVEIMGLFALLDPSIQDLRGIGVTISKLERFSRKTLPTSEAFFGKKSVSANNSPSKSSTELYQKEDDSEDSTDEEIEQPIEPLMLRLPDPEFKGSRDYNAVKRKLTQMIETEPEKEGVSKVGDYLVSLIVCHRARETHQLLRVLYRLIRRSENALWKSSYSRIQSQVEAAMVQVYKCPMAEVPRSF